MSEPSNSREERKTSIIVVCAGQLEYTRLCVHSLLQYGHRAAEILLIDLASLDGTREFLQGVAIASPLNIRVVRIDDDWTYARAYAMGASRVTGDSLVLLNNDVIVSPGWLEQLTALADFDPAIGMVGAMSNAAPAPQSVGAVPYTLKPEGIRESDRGIYPDEVRASLGELASFARRWRENIAANGWKSKQLHPFAFLSSVRSLIKLAVHFRKHR